MEGEGPFVNPRSAERLPGTRDRSRHIAHGTEGGVGEKVDVVVSQEGRNIIRGIERRVGNDARVHQHRREARPLVLPEEVRDGNHQGEQGQHPHHHTGDHADCGKAGGGCGVALHEMFLHRGQVERGCRRERGIRHRCSDEDPVAPVELHIMGVFAGSILKGMGGGEDVQGRVW